jgi:hypothetical protein
MTTTLPERTPTGLLIGGEWLQTAAHLDVINPATLGSLAEIGDATPKRDSKPLVRRTTPSKRGVCPRLVRVRKSCARRSTS